VPELQVAVEVAAGADGDLQRVLGLALGDARGAACVAVHQQAGVVTTDGVASDEDGVGLGADLVHPVEVLGVRQQKALRGGVVDVSVH